MTILGLIEVMTFLVWVFVLENNTTTPQHATPQHVYKKTKIKSDGTWVEFENMELGAGWQGAGSVEPCTAKIRSTMDGIEYVEETMDVF